MSFPGWGSNNNPPPPPSAGGGQSLQGTHRAGLEGQLRGLLEASLENQTHVTWFLGANVFVTTNTFHGAPCMSNPGHAA